MKTKLKYFPIKIKRITNNKEIVMTNKQIIEDIEFNIDNLKNSLILGEPGIGKTRLLKEIAKIKHDDFNIIKYHFNEFNIDIKNEINENEKYLYLIDGLDEIDEKNIAKKLHIITQLKCDNTHFIITSRNNVIDAVNNYLNNFNKYQILKLEEEDVVNILKSNLKNINDEKIKMIINQLNSIITVPRYLEYIIELIERKELDYSQKINKYKIFNSIIDINLKDILKEKNFGLIPHINKNLLQKLALTMSISRKIELTEDEFVNFLSDYPSEIKNYLLNNTTYNEFINKFVLVKIDNKISFYNKEFQEFLTAKEIIDLNLDNRGIYDLVTDENGNINSMFVNTLSFIIQNNSDFGKILFRYLQSNINLHQFYKDILYDNISYIDTIDEANYYIDNIVKLIKLDGNWLDHSHYQSIINLIKQSEEYGINKLLQVIQDTINTDAVTVTKDNTKRIIIYNIIRLFIFYIESNQDFLLKETMYSSIYKLINVFKDDSYILMNIFELLYYLIDTQKFMSLLQDYENDLTLDFAEYLFELLNKNKDDDLFEYSLNFFIAHYQNNNSGIHSNLLIFLRNLNKSEICKLLNILLSDERAYIILKYFDHDFYNQDSKTNQIILNSKQEFFIPIYLLFKKSLENNQDYFYFNNHNHRNTIKLIANLISNFYQIDKVVNDYLLYYNTFFKIEYYRQLLFNIMEKEIDLVIKSFNCRKKFQQLEQLVNDYFYSNFYNIKNDTDNKVILKYSKKFEEVKLDYNKEEEKNKVTIKYSKLLNQIPELLNNEIKIENRIIYFNNNFLRDLELIEELKQSYIIQLNKFINYVKAFLRTFNSDDMTQIEPTDDNGFRYNIRIQALFSSIKILLKLNVNIDEFKKLIIFYYPVGFYISEIEKLKFSSKDFDWVNLLFTNTKYKKYLNHWLTNLMNILQLYDISNFDNLIIEKLFSNELNEFNSMTILNYIYVNIDIIGKINEEKLELLSDYYSESTKIQDIIENIKIKINNYNSIMKRVDYIKHTFGKKFKINDNGNMHSVGELENELLFSQYYLKPLSNIDFKYHDFILDLLKDSLERLNDNVDYYYYGTYILKLVKKFIENSQNNKEIKYFYKKIDKMFDDYHKYKNISQIRYQYYSFKNEHLDKSQITIRHAINIIKNAIDNNKFINNDKDLIDFVDSKLKIEVKKRFYDEGYINVISEIYRIKENVAQKIISLLLENTFLSEGFSKNSLIIHREVEKPDGKRVDFAVKYGFLGTIIIEIKLSNNKDFKNQKGRERYKNKLINYLGLDNSIFLFYFIIKLKNEDIERFYKNIKEVNNIFKDYSRIKVLS